PPRRRQALWRLRCCYHGSRNSRALEGADCLNSSRTDAAALREEAQCCGYSESSQRARFLASRLNPALDSRDVGQRMRVESTTLVPSVDTTVYIVLDDLWG